MEPRSQSLGRGLSDTLQLSTVFSLHACSKTDSTVNTFLPKSLSFYQYNGNKAIKTCKLLSTQAFSCLDLSWFCWELGKK